MVEWFEWLEALWPAQYIFILGHMRSRSSLLSHLLGSHPEICGYTESHIKYRNHWDLARLRWHIVRSTRSWPRGRYLLDKQLHSRMYLPANLRASDKLRVIILVRPPLETIRSIVHMGRRTGNARDADPHRATAYYCERLAMLASQAIELRERALLIDSNTLIDDPTAALSAIGEHLDLRTPLKPQYLQMQHTGRIGAGDMSPLIRRGEIVPLRSSSPSFSFPGELTRQLERSYAHFVDDATTWASAIGFKTDMSLQHQL